MLPVIAWLYAPVLTRLFAVWMHSPFFSHGIFVPAFAALVLWRDRKKLKAIEAAPSLAGLPLVGLALLMRHSTVLRGGLFFSGVSLLLLLAGLVILLYGWEFFRAVLFPWAFLILMIPVPFVILHKATFLLVPTLKLSAFLLQLAGIPLVREGNAIVLDANSTLFSFDAARWNPLLPDSVDRGHHARLFGGQSQMGASSAGMLLSAHRNFCQQLSDCWYMSSCLVLGLDEVELFSPYSGCLIFAVSLIMLFILHRLILSIWGGSPEAKYSMPLPATTTSTLG